MDVTELRARLAQNRARYDAACAVTVARSDAGDAEGVLQGAAFAAYSAWMDPIGILADPALERLIVKTARGSGGATRVDGARTTGRVLHVLTESYATGGHSRLAWRWIRRDQRRSDVVLTHQSNAIPHELLAATTASGGQLISLPSEAERLIERAELLRQRMDQADLVICHAHPHDTVVVAAANLPGVRPPIIFVDHADHTFWLGLSCADLVVGHRPIAATIAERWRGISPHRVAMLPLPIDAPERSTSRAEIRRELRIGGDTVVAFSAAAAYKYRPAFGAGFDSVVGDALRANLALVVVLAGPTPDAQWEGLRQQFPQRLFLLGNVADTEPWLAAADIYLDSFPVASGTSLLEAAAYGLPVMRMPTQEGDLEILQSDFPELAVGTRPAKNKEAYDSALRALVRHPRLRRERGKIAQRVVLERHSGENWTEALEALYARARRTSAAAVDSEGKPAASPDYGVQLVALSEPELNETNTSRYSLGLQRAMPDLSADLHFALEARSELAVRVQGAWERSAAEAAWLVRASSSDPRVHVSFSLSSDDDGSGSRSVEHLTHILNVAGLNADTCGDVALETQAEERPSSELLLVIELERDGVDRVAHYVAALDRCCRAGGRANRVA